MTKKLIAFDLDGTLAPSKSPLPDRMGELIPKLLDKFQVCVMSGGKFELFETQLISNLKAHHNQLNNLHLMPTCGTRYYRFNPKTEEWGIIYAEDFTPEQKAKIVDKLAPLLPEFEVRAGGLTTIDVTKQGIDKAYGMSKLLKRLGLNKEEALFMGDRLKEGGNDYPVKAMGVDCIEVSSWVQTANEIEKLLKEAG